MDQICDMAEMLNTFICPAFSVKDAVIADANHAARYLGLEPDTAIAPLLNDQQAYEAFTDGCLYLTLSIHDRDYSAAITREDGYDLFILDHELEQQQLWTLALASQEMRIPLADIMTGMEWMLQQLPQDGAADSRKRSASVRRSLNQLHRMLCNMSDAARYSCETNIHQQTHDMAAIFDEVFEKAAVLAEQKGVALRFRSLRQIVDGLADTEKIERAILNLISNALKVTPKGGTIEARLTRHGNKLHLTVQDSGPGIPAEKRAAVFTQYMRRPSLIDGTQGIGLGMVMVRAAAAAHNGTVLLEYPEGKGTKVTVTFSVRQSTSPRLGTPISILEYDYAGGWDHALLELSDALPLSAYETE